MPWFNRLTNRLTRQLQPTHPVVVLTGAMAAGKSSVAQILSAQLSPSVHLRGDSFRRAIVNGRVDMGQEPATEALRQLELRYQLTVQCAKTYQAAGFWVIHQDVILGDSLDQVMRWYGRTQVQLFVLNPDAATIQQRESARDKTGYGAIDIGNLQQALAATPKLGTWIDSSTQSLTETANTILNNLPRST